MSQNLDGLRDPFGRFDVGSRAELRESEIAFCLQNSQPGDPNLVEILVKSYAEELLWMIQIILQEPPGKNPPSEKQQSILIDTITQAVSHVDQFWGESSVRNWLYAQAVNAARVYKHKLRFSIPFVIKSRIRDDGSGSKRPQNVGEVTSESLNDLPEKQRQTLLLRYVLQLEINDISSILNTKSEKIHTWLTEIRDRFTYSFSQLKDQQYEKSTIPEGGDHQINRARIQTRMDGLLEKNSKEEILLREHLLKCESCRVYAENLEQLTGQLSNALKQNYPRPRLINNDLDILIHLALDRLSQSGRHFPLVIPLKRGIWLVLVALLFVSGMFTLIRITPERGEFPATPTPTERFLPTPINLSEEQFPNDYDSEDYQFAIYALEPKMSADGRWIVFDSNASLSEAHDFQNTLDIMLYDAQTQTMKRIASQVMSFSGPLMASPDISADGRYIVFNGVVNVFEEGDMGCWTETYEDCVDIILYDRLDESYKRITRSYDGGSSDGNSVMPTISENGRWIVFWSMASNLVEGVTETCGADVEDISCYKIYIYDRVNEQIDVIPINKPFASDIELLSFIGFTNISDDGRWLLISLTKPESGTNMEEVGVYLYDREQNVLEPVDVALDGSDGNGRSSIGTMTPDSQYIAFSSSSSNLIPGDDNGYGDIFLRDRTNAKTEIISIARDGTMGNGDSGIESGIFWRSVDISDDGRYIVFMSTANNLDPRLPAYCRPLEGLECIYLYVHDRVTGDNVRIAEPQDDKSILMLPSISNDGRWISYMSVSYDCDLDICVDLNVYDRERGWTSEMTRNIFPRSGIPWELDTIIGATDVNISGIDYAPDGGSLALIIGRTLKLVNADTGEELLTLHGNSGAIILTVSFSPDGRYIAGGAADGSVNIWRVSDGSLAFLLDNHPGRVIDLQFSSDGEYLYAATPRELWIWQRIDRKFTRVNSVKYSEIYIKDIDISPTHELMAVVPGNEPYVWIQHLPGEEVVHRLAGPETNLSSVSFSPDGEYLLVQYGDGPLQIWQLEIDALGLVTPKLLTEVNVPNPLAKIAFSPDGNYATVGSMYGGVLMLEMPSGRNYLMPDSDSLNYVFGVAFSPDGDKLAAASGDGVYLWRKTSKTDDTEFFTVINTDEFIQIPNRRRPLENVETSLDLDRIAIRGITLYQAHDQSSFDVYAPFKLPANLSYVMTSIMQDGSVMTQYRWDDPVSGEPKADLYFRQQLISGADRPFWVGEGGAIEFVDVSGIRAEYIKGDWLDIPHQKPTTASDEDLQNIHWTWSSEVEVQQLHWRHLNEHFSLIYIPRLFTKSDVKIDSADSDGDTIQQIHLTKNDLIKIADGVVSLRRIDMTAPILLEYTVKPGDTCTAIAFKYDTTVSALVALNDIEDNCELITVGQTLQVPLPEERLPLTETDLDCDGNLERLRIIPTPANIDSNINYGIVLEALSDTGLYKDRWQYTVADADAEYLGRPQLLNTGSCQQLLAVNVMGSVPEGENGSGLKIFEWNNGSMDLIFTADGLLQSVTSIEGGLSLSTLKVEYLPGTSSCNRTNTDYIWDGEAFSETGSFVEEGGSCGLR